MTATDPDHSAKDKNVSDVIRDPVCGMTVDPDAGKPTADHDGHTYYFCSDSCRQKFRADPDAYRTAKDPVCGMTVELANRNSTQSLMPILATSQRQNRCQQALSIRARCTLKSLRMRRATARNAAWRLNR